MYTLAFAVYIAWFHMISFHYIQSRRNTDPTVPHFEGTCPTGDLATSEFTMEFDPISAESRRQRFSSKQVRSIELDTVERRPSGKTTTVDIESSISGSRGRMEPEEPKEQSSLITHTRRHFSDRTQSHDENDDNVSELSFTSAFSQHQDGEYDRMETTV